MNFDPSTVDRFRYEHFEFDAASGRLVCTYSLDDVTFQEQVCFEPSPAVGAEATDAARLVFLLAGVSYYKAAAPPLVDLGGMAITDAERSLLESFYVDGLGEYAYKNQLDLTALRFDAEIETPAPVSPSTLDRGPLIPFGGGIDSIVTVEGVRSRLPGAALFIASQAGSRFEAIEAAAEVTGLPVLRAERILDPKILRSKELGYRNGHVPVTGIISAIALLAAILDGRPAVVMSNEWSSSSGNVRWRDRLVNHQYSKSFDFEVRFRDALRSRHAEGVRYYSWLRPFSELWVARRFAKLTDYHHVFRSCNRAFHIDPDQRLDSWCGVCDKCCFIDLILAPFLGAGELQQIFGQRPEPLANPQLHDQFRTLLGLSDNTKPFECVGDTDECRAALRLTAARDDRRGFPLVERLGRELNSVPAPHAQATPDHYFAAMGSHHVPEDHAPEDLLV